MSLESSDMSKRSHAGSVAGSIEPQTCRVRSAIIAACTRQSDRAEPTGHVGHSRPISVPPVHVSSHFSLVAHG
jgi:hypothetical protein